MDVFFFVGAVWVGMYALAVGLFGWLCGAAVGQLLGGPTAIDAGGAAGLTLAAAAAFGCSRADRGLALALPLVLAAAGGMAAGGLVGSASLGPKAGPVIGPAVGLLAGLAAGVLRPDTGLRGTPLLLGVGAASGLLAGLVGWAAGGPAGWGIGAALGLALPPLLARAFRPDAVEEEATAAQLALGTARRALSGTLAGTVGAGLLRWNAAQLGDDAAVLAGQALLIPALIVLVASLVPVFRLVGSRREARPGRRLAPTLTLPVRPGPITALVVTPDGREIVAAGPDGFVRRWSVTDGSEVDRWGMPRDLRGEPYLSADGALVAFVGAEVCVRAVSTGGPVREFPTPAAPAEAVFLPGGRSLLILGWDGGVHRGDLDAGTVVPLGLTAEGAGLALSADGAVAAVGSEGGIICFDPRTGDELGRVETGRPGVAVRALALSEDGGRVAFGLADGSVGWAARSAGRLTRADGEHAGAVLTAALSPDERFLATGGSDHTGRLWDLVTGAEVLRLEGHGGWLAPGAVERVAFTPDGRHLVTAGADATVRLWDLSGPAAS